MSSTVRTIDRLLSRVQHSTVIDEKIDALRQLAELPLPDLTEARVSEVLSKTLVEIVENDQQLDDEDVCSEIVRTLLILTSNVVSGSDVSAMNDTIEAVAEIEHYASKNVEIMLDIPHLFHTFQICLSDKHRAQIRLFTLQLILNAVKAQRCRVQESILLQSGFIKVIVETLSNSAEVLRNESILLLEALVEDNPTIQNISVFDGVFEILLQIVTDEGGSGVVACDCYRLISSLLQGADSNVKYFGELGCIERIPKILVQAYESINHQSQPETKGSEIRESPRTETSPKICDTTKPTSIVSLELLVSVICNFCRLPGVFQPQIFSSNMAHALYAVIDDAKVSTQTKCNLLRVVGRALLGCKRAQSVFPLIEVSSCPLVVYHLRLAMNGADVALCSNALFVLESYFYMNEEAQVEALSTLVPVSDSDSTKSPLFGTELVQSLSRWQSDMKCLGDCVLFWTTCRILSITLRRNDLAKQIAVSTALSIPVDDRPAPRMIDLTVRTIQMAFDSSHTDARVRVSLLILLCELLVQSQQSVHSLLQTSHLTETLLAGQAWKSSDPIISGLSCLIWAFCLDSANPETCNPLLHRIIMVQIGVDTFKACLSKLKSSVEWQNPRPERSFEPMLLNKIQLFDSFFVEQSGRVIDLCDSRILTLVISRDDSVSSEPKMIPSSLISDELISARSKIVQLEADLMSALKALADKTDEAALTRYRLDLAQKELNSLTEGKTDASFEELRQNYEELQSAHNELKSQYSDLIVLLASLESEREAKVAAQKHDERLEQSQSENVSLI